MGERGIPGPKGDRSKLAGSTGELRYSAGIVVQPEGADQARDIRTRRCRDDGNGNWDYGPLIGRASGSVTAIPVNLVQQRRLPEVRRWKVLGHVRQGVTQMPA